MINKPSALEARESSVSADHSLQTPGIPYQNHRLMFHLIPFGLMKNCV